MAPSDGAYPGFESLDGHSAQLPRLCEAVLMSTYLKREITMYTLMVSRLVQHLDRRLFGRGFGVLAFVSAKSEDLVRHVQHQLKANQDAEVESRYGRNGLAL